MENNKTPKHKLIISKAGSSGRRKMDIDELLAHINIDKIVMVEIGSYAGESASIFMRSGKVKKISCIDPWKNGYDKEDTASHLHPMDFVEKSFDKRTKRFGNKVVKIRSTSEAACKMFKDGSLDLVYIDGCHKYENVKQDIELWLPKVKKFGFIGGHDYNQDDTRLAINHTIKNVNKVFELYSWVKRI